MYREAEYLGYHVAQVLRKRGGACHRLRAVGPSVPPPAVRGKTPTRLHFHHHSRLIVALFFSPHTSFTGWMPRHRTIVLANHSRTVENSWKSPRLRRLLPERRYLTHDANEPNMNLTARLICSYWCAVQFERDSILCVLATPDRFFTLLYKTSGTRQ